MDDYLSKPFQAEQLVAIVKKWVDNRAGVCVETGVGGRVEALTGAKLTKE
jgi:DNA-binding response OmpR family regulator